MQVSNTGNANAGPFTVGLYLSTAVDPTTELCAVDTRYPLRDAIQLASASFTGLAQGQTLPVVFQPGNAIEYWMASQWNSGRWNMFRCLFVFANDGNTVYELQATETDNLALAPVRLLDLVDLAPSSYQVDFTAVPWLSARIYNAGLVTSPLFHVDFYQV